MRERKEGDGAKRGNKGEVINSGTAATAIREEGGIEHEKVKDKQEGR